MEFRRVLFRSAGGRRPPDQRERGGLQHIQLGQLLRLRRSRERRELRKEERCVRTAPGAARDAVRVLIPERRHAWGGRVHGSFLLRDRKSTRLNSSHSQISY